MEMSIEKAKKLIKTYIINTTDNDDEFDVYLVWECKLGDNWKFSFRSTTTDTALYELTYIAINDTCYIDIYNLQDHIQIFH